MPEAVKQYYVLNPDLINEVGGHRIVQRGSHRVVLMQPGQAEYWIDQGAIGDQPGTIKSGAVLGEKRRVRGTGSIKPEAKKKEGG